MEDVGEGLDPLSIIAASTTDTTDASTIDANGGNGGLVDTLGGGLGGGGLGGGGLGGERRNKDDIGGFNKGIIKGATNVGATNIEANVGANVGANEPPNEPTKEQTKEPTKEGTTTKGDTQFGGINFMNGEGK